MMVKTGTTMFCATAVAFNLQLVCCCSLRASDAESQQRAAELVREALHRKAYGLDDECRGLLEKAVHLAPDYPPARWNLGYVRHDNRWIKAEQLRADPERLAVMKEYRRIRPHFRHTVVSQMQLADWCRDHKLPEQERAHLMQALDVKPHHEPALLRLGYKPVPGGGWVSEEEIAQARRHQLTEKVLLARWRPQMESIRVELASANEKRRQQAQQKLKSVACAQAFGAMEEVLSTDSQWSALLVVKVLRDMTDPEAALSLARHAVFSPWHEVRESAARSLQQRSYESFVPALLATMATPIDSRVAMVRGRAGRLQPRAVLLRERNDSYQRLQLDEAVSPGELVVQLRRDQARTELLNISIARALNVATEQDLPADPHAWWEWWDEYNEVYVAGQKPIRDYSREAELARIDRIRDFQEQQRKQDTMEWAKKSAELQRQWRIKAARKHSCLAAGTPVWTSSGTTAIEKIQPGDVVLAQHPMTGELAYKTVLRTTVRPASPLVKLHLGGETLLVTGGHPFWVAGRGWMKARELESGMIMHGQRETSQVSFVEEGPQLETYNLIVEGFSTYFVGHSKILSHDNTPRDATHVSVPGLPWQ